MAWDWSFGPDTVEAIRESIKRQLTSKDSCEVLAEYAAHSAVDGPDWSIYDRVYDEYRNDPHSSHENRCEIIFQLASEVTRTAENGGFRVWGCPFGCEAHLITIEDIDE